MSTDPREATRAKIVEADAILQRALAEFGLQPGDPAPRPSLTYNTRAAAMERIAGPPASPAMPEIVMAAVEFERCGRLIAAGLALCRLRERFDEFMPGDLPPDERTWREFCTKWLAFGADRANELIGRLVHRGALLKCDACGIEATCRCSCGAPYVPARWPVEAAEVVRTALDRAVAAVAADPDKSNRAIAREIDVSFETVRRARQKLADGAGHVSTDVSPEESQ